MKQGSPVRVFMVLVLAAAPFAAAGDARLLEEMCLPAGILEQPVCLAGGHWEGEPYVAGAASRPGIRLLDGFGLTADLDGDGRDEVAGLISVNSGGSGERIYLVVVRPGPAATEVLGAQLLGDRLRVRSLAAEENGLRVDVVGHGEGDPMCCPSQQAVLRFGLSGGTLVGDE